jgi:peroxiredoxin-like protein
MAEHIYEYQGNWQGGLTDGTGTFQAGALQSAFSVPSDMRGRGEGTSPEELILAAAGSCYLITLSGIMQFQRIPAKDFKIKSKGVFTMTSNGPVMSRLEHYPEVYVASELYETVSEQVLSCIKMAKQNCLISKAIAGNVTVTAKGTVHPA